MLVAEELALLKGVITELEEKYCQNCQEWDCDCCWAEQKGEKNEQIKTVSVSSTRRENRIVDGSR